MTTDQINFVLHVVLGVLVAYGIYMAIVLVLVITVFVIVFRNIVSTNRRMNDFRKRF